MVLRIVTVPVRSGKLELGLVEPSEVDAIAMRANAAARWLSSVPAVVDANSGARASMVDSTSSMRAIAAASPNLTA